MLGTLNTVPHLIMSPSEEDKPESMEVKSILILYSHTQDLITGVTLFLCS